MLFEKWKRVELSSALTWTVYPRCFNKANLTYRKSCP